MSIARIVPLVALLVASVAARANPDPQLGRFLQRDPNASGQIVMNDATWFHGRAPFVGKPFVDMRTMYGDGMNLYEYLGSNPLTRSDPMGLSWDPFDMVDEIGFEHQLSGAIALAKIDSYFRDKEVLRKIRGYEHGMFTFMMDFVWDRDVGILFSMIGGPFFSKICFVEGTAIATPTGPEAIECLALGREITSEKDPQQVGEKNGVELPPGTDGISLVRMHYRHADGSVTTMEMLRPAKLVASLRLGAGSRLPVVLPEMGFAEDAEVLAVEPYCDPIRLDVPVVTGRFVTDAAEIVNVYLEGYERPIGVTPKHPVFSADRETWVASGDLQPGERLKSTNGVAVVTRVEHRAARATVYNVEVSRYHTYFVGDAGVWAHNPCSPNQANKLIQQGKAPSTIVRVDVGKIPGELTHVHFQGGAALNNNGTWKHGSKVLTNAEKLFITEVLGWPLP